VVWSSLKVKTTRYGNSIGSIFIQFTQVAIFLITSLLQRILPSPFYFGMAPFKSGCVHVAPIKW
jgi:hypothetical protein